tara:strand:+ start:1087 stop:1482 length:396 start_codon:yes stop_codon:yes gene_type:complete
MDFLKVTLMFTSIFCYGQYKDEPYGFVEGEIYNPCKVTKDTFGAVKKHGQWVLPVEHPFHYFIKKGYMIHPKKPNCLIVNPYTRAGRKLIASSKPKYAPSRGYKNTFPSSKHKDYGIASDYLKKKNKETEE